MEKISENLSTNFSKESHEKLKRNLQRQLEALEREGKTEEEKYKKIEEEYNRRFGEGGSM